MTSSSATAVTVKCGVQLWNGVRLGDDVFVGPNATFTNDPFPRSEGVSGAFLADVVANGAPIGANATILPGVPSAARDGRRRRGGDRDVPPHAIVVGNPAVIVGYPTAAERRLARSRDRAFGREGRAPSIRRRRVSQLVAFTLRGRPARQTSPPDRVQPRAAVRAAAILRRLWRAGRTRRVASTRIASAPSSSCAVNGRLARRRRRRCAARRGPCSTARRRVRSRPPRAGDPVQVLEPDTVLLVLASHPYHAADYIRDYDQFLAVAGGQPTS